MNYLQFSASLRWAFLNSALLTTRSGTIIRFDDLDQSKVVEELLQQNGICAYFEILFHKNEIFLISSICNFLIKSNLQADRSEANVSILHKLRKIGRKQVQKYMDDAFFQFYTIF